MDQPPDHYAAPGVAAPASQDEIKRKYRKLAWKHHPDKNPNDPKAADTFKQISEAYQTLGDAEKRKQYDDMRRLGAFCGFGGGARQDPPRAQYRYPPPAATSNIPRHEFRDVGLGGPGTRFSSRFSRPTCGGAGELRQRRTMQLTVPPGVDTGTKMRLKGKAAKGTKGAAPGDLLITFNVKADRFYQREGLDLIAPVPINIVDATLGKKINVKTLDGTRVAIRIPPGTQSGKRFRVRGKASEKDGTRADLIVHLDLCVPETVTPQQEQAMRKFAETMKP